MSSLVVVECFVHVGIITGCEPRPIGILPHHQLPSFAVVCHGSDVDHMTAAASEFPILRLLLGKSLDLSKGSEGELEVFEVAGFTPGEGDRGRR